MPAFWSAPLLDAAASGAPPDGKYAFRSGAHFHCCPSWGSVPTASRP